MTALGYGAADRVRKAGDTMSGTLVLGGAPPLNVPAATAGEVLTSDGSGNITPQPTAPTLMPSGDPTGTADLANIQAVISTTGQFPQLIPGPFGSVFWVKQPIVIVVPYTGFWGTYGGGVSSHNIATDLGVTIKPTAGFTNPTYAAFATGVVLVIDSAPGTAGAQPTNQILLAGIKIDGSAGPAALPTPTGLTVTPTGATGSTTYGYRVSALNGFGETFACQEVKITNGNSILTSGNYNALAWAAVAGATGYRVYGRTASGETYLATVGTNSYNDTGAATPDGVTIPPLANTTGVDGIATYGPVQCLTIRGCNVYQASGQGVGQYADPAASPSNPDSLSISDTMIEKCGGHGLYSVGADIVAGNLHCQDNAGWGAYLRGSNGHFDALCRMDVNGLGGIALDCPVNAGYGTTGTSYYGSSQRNKGPCAAVVNSSVTGTDNREPLIIPGGHFAADGGNGTSAAFSIRGKGLMVLGEVFQSTGNIDQAGGAPVYTFEAFTAGTSAAVPLGFFVSAGALRWITAMANNPAGAPIYLSPLTQILSGLNSLTPQAGIAGLVNAPSLILSSAAAAFGSLLSLTASASGPASHPLGYLAAAAADKVFGIRVAGDTTSRLGLDSNGKFTWGPGTGTDLNLYRASAGVLQTDQSFTASGTLTAGGPFVWANAHAANTKPSNPASTASTSLVMMGCAVAYTPTGTGRILVQVTGTGNTATTAVSFTAGLRYGTGTAPSNGAAVTGTRFGAAADASVRPGVVGSGATPLAWTDVITGLTAGTAYWFDVALSTSAGADAASVANLSFSIVELP